MIGQTKEDGKVEEAGQVKEIVAFKVALFDSDSKPYTITADTDAQEIACEQDPRFLGWLTGWAEAEMLARKP